MSGVLAIIPARLRSTRLPNKALRNIDGMSLLERVYRQALQSKSISRVAIATDSEEIQRLAAGFGAEVLMTAPEIANGSERVAVAAKMISGKFDAVANIQGDMPFIHPEVIDGTVDFFLQRRGDFEMATVATPIVDEQTFLSHSDVKVVIGDKERALYFSRAAVPHSRDGQRLLDKTSGRNIYGYKHFGLYVFSEKALEEYSRQAATELESIECLEQLRLLARGYRIGVKVVDAALTARSVEVDTENDLARAENIAQGRA